MQIWKDCKSHFKNELNDEEFSAWINPLDFTQYADDNGVKSYYVLAPNDFIKEHIRINFDNKFRNFLTEATGNTNFSLIYDLSTKHKLLKLKKKNKNISLFTDKENSLVENFTFETFVEGKSNHIALAAAKHVSELPEGAYNPCLLYTSPSPRDRTRSRMPSSA